MADLLPLPTDLALVLLDPDIGIDTLAADQLKVAVAPISLLVLQSIYDCKIVFGTPASNSTVHISTTMKITLQYDELVVSLLLVEPSRQLHCMYIVI